MESVSLVLLDVDDSKKSSDASANNDFYPEDVDNNLQVD